jgi:GT2 family glycosyltransferase
VPEVRSPRAELVLLTYNGRELLQAALPSVFGQAYERESFGLIVVDNGSEDGSHAYLAERWPEARVVALPENVGVTAALNRGVEAANAPYIGLLNNDVELAPDWLSELVCALEQHPEAASATGKLLNFSQRDVIDGVGDVVSWSGSCVRRGRGELDRGQFDEPEEVFSASGAAALYRRSAFETVGLFDEDFYAYLEDVDWGFRARLAGFTCRYVPTAVGYHIGGATTGGASDFYHAHLRRNAALLVLKDYPASRILRHAHEIVAYQLALLLVSLREGKAREHLGGLGETLRTLPRTLRKRRRIQRSRLLRPGQLEALLGHDRGYELSATGARRFARAGLRLVTRARGDTDA